VRVTAIADAPDDNPRRRFDDDLPKRPLPRSCVDLLGRLGVNVDSEEDIRDLAATIRWAAEERARQAQRSLDLAADKRERRSRLYAVGYGMAATGIGGLVTWLISHGTIGLIP
jgi:hypothetical protein